MLRDEQVNYFEFWRSSECPSNWLVNWVRALSALSIWLPYAQWKYWLTRLVSKQNPFPISSPDGSQWAYIRYIKWGCSPSFRHSWTIPALTPTACFQPKTQNPVSGCVTWPRTWPFRPFNKASAAVIFLSMNASLDTGCGRGAGQRWSKRPLCDFHFCTPKHGKT